MKIYNATKQTHLIGGIKIAPEKTEVIDAQRVEDLRKEVPYIDNLFMNGGLNILVDEPAKPAKKEEVKDGS